MFSNLYEFRFANYLIRNRIFGVSVGDAKKYLREKENDEKKTFIITMLLNAEKKEINGKSLKMFFVQVLHFSCLVCIHSIDNK